MLPDQARSAAARFLDCGARFVTFAGAGSSPCSVSLSSPRMNASTRSRAMSSWIWMGGLFMKYDDGPTSVPVSPRSRPSFRQRTASMTTPALFGLSQTSSLSSALSGTSPNVVPSIRM